MTKKKIIVTSTVTVKKSSNVRQITRKAIAGLSEAELIERNSIGTYEEKDNTEDDEKRKRTKEKN